MSAVIPTRLANDSILLDRPKGHQISIATHEDSYKVIIGENIYLIIDNKQIKLYGKTCYPTPEINNTSNVILPISVKIKDIWEIFIDVDRDFEMLNSQFSEGLEISNNLTDLLIHISDKLSYLEIDFYNEFISKLKELNYIDPSSMSYLRFGSELFINFNGNVEGLVRLIKRGYLPYVPSEDNPEFCAKKDLAMKASIKGIYTELLRGLLRQLVITLYN